MSRVVASLCAALAVLALFLLVAPRLAHAQEAAPGRGIGALKPAPAGAVVDLGAPSVDANAPEQPEPAGGGTVVAFWIFAAVTILGALLTITRKNAVSAVMFLVGTFFGIAAIYTMLFAHFMAAIQVLVYAGAIMVLFVFVVMILNKEEEEPWALKGIVGKMLAGGALLYFLVRMGKLMWDLRLTLSPANEKPWGPGEFAAFGTTKAIGAELFTSYLFPFEAISVALLIAIVGAVVLAHPDHPSEEGGQGGKANG